MLSCCGCALLRFVIFLWVLPLLTLPPLLASWLLDSNLFRWQLPNLTYSWESTSPFHPGTSFFPSISSTTTDLATSESIPNTKIFCFDFSSFCKPNPRTSMQPWGFVVVMVLMAGVCDGYVPFSSGTLPSLSSLCSIFVIFSCFMSGHSLRFPFSFLSSVLLFLSYISLALHIYNPPSKKCNTIPCFPPSPSLSLFSHSRTHSLFL